MPLTDDQIERYSRQLILPEIGPGGQERLGAARVAVVGEGVAAERVVACLAAAGVGWIAAAPALHGACDPAQPDLCLVPLQTGGNTAVDVAIVVACDIATVTADAERWRERAGATLWIAEGLAGALPACPRCAATALAMAPVPGDAPVRDALLGTIVATEAVKTLLAIGTPIAGRVVRYDTEEAAITIVSVAPSCPNCTRAG